MAENTLFIRIAERCKLEHFCEWLRKKGYEAALDSATLPLSSEERENRLTSSPLWEKYMQETREFEDKHWKALASMLLKTAKDEEVKLLETGTARRYVQGGIQTPNIVSLTAGALEIIKGLPPAYALPMVIRPVPWTRLDHCGYRYRPMSLVKHRDNATIRDALKDPNAKLGDVYKAVNALQDTPWRINTFVYKVMQDMQAKGMQFPEVMRPSEIHKLRRCGQVRRARREGKKARLYLKLIQHRLEVGGRFLNTRFYFPYQLDFRGRAYAVPPLFNPQADDMARGLLKFADGKDVGDTGAKWLAVHLANMWGKATGENAITVDKQCFEAREKWAYDNEAKIRETVQDPLQEDPFWRQAKKPWRFLAACKEWVGYRESPEAFQSRLPIAMDGTCNGFQHLSAILLDGQGGKATNLCPDEKPNDIYRIVAEEVRSEVESAARGPDCKEQGLAKKWLEIGIDRDVVKPGTMTTPYGAGTSTKIEQLIEAIEKSGKVVTCDDARQWRSALRRCRDEVKTRLDQAEPFTRLKKIILENLRPERIIGLWLDRASRELARYLVPLLNNAIKDTCRAHGMIAEWLREVVGVLAQKGEPIRWESPTGFPVAQAEWIYPKRRMGSARHGRHKLSDTSQPGRIDENAQKRGIVPNFVHSFDAAHMMLTVNALHSNGLEHFAVVHDSYAVHACDVDALNRALRDAFVGIYQKDVLQGLYDRQRETSPEIPRPPQRGTKLDIRSVLQSDYFFS
jgi:DNA-directed RNA polymerase